MPLPSFYKSENSERAWNLTRAAGYGALLGVLAALFKTLGPFHARSAGGGLTDHLVEIVVAAAAFAALCAGAAALRNYLARRLVWDERR